MGAMSKKQWTKHVGYSLSAGGHIDQPAIDAIVASLPNDFVFVDVDLRFAILEELAYFSVEKLAEWGKFVSDRQKDIPLQIVNDI